MLIERTILDKVGETIARFDLLEPYEPIPVALSGGKDSLVLTLALNELGYEAVPLAVDMGYVPGWGESLRSRFRRLGLTVDVLDARAGDVHGPTQVALGRRIDVLNRLTPSDVDRFTPCTHCYSAKVLVLDARLQELGHRRIAFGHHRTDALASLLKAGLMHIDRWVVGNRRFDRHNFERLAHALGAELRHFASEGPGPILTHIERLAAAGAIDTDEPPRQQLRHDTGTGLELIRPLAAVDEIDIAAVARRARLPVEGSGCGHGATHDSETPREIVHNRTLRERLCPEALAFLVCQMGHGLDAAGRSRRATRYRRSELLGADYRPAAGGEAKL